MKINPPPPLEESSDRLASLERENARLRRRLDSIIGLDTPNFDPVVFQKTLARALLRVVSAPILVMGIGMALVMVPNGLHIPRIAVGPTVLIDPAGMYTGHPGIGVGIIAFGGLAIGVVAFGGGAVGFLAIGGGALGVFAFGGGAVGVVACGGGACGYVAIGGGGFGRYVLAGDGRGSFVFSRRRQDKRAVELFTRLFPRLRASLTTPMPVIPIDGFER